jgi:hypothetical protein
MCRDQKSGKFCSIGRGEYLTCTKMHYDDDCELSVRSKGGGCNGTLRGRAAERGAGEELWRWVELSCIAGN